MTIASLPPVEYFEIKDNFCFVHIKVITGASKSEISDVKDGRLRVRIAAVPEGGKANSALASFFAKKLKLPKSAISISSGEKSRLKTICFPNRINFEGLI